MGENKNKIVTKLRNNVLINVHFFISSIILIIIYYFFLGYLHFLVAPTFENCAKTTNRKKDPVTTSKARAWRFFSKLLCNFFLVFGVKKVYSWWISQPNLVAKNLGFWAKCRKWKISSKLKRSAKAPMALSSKWVLNFKRYLSFKSKIISFKGQK